MEVCIQTKFSIQTAAKISGLSVFTLRTWEKRYHAFAPVRDSLGHRNYSKIEVEKMSLLNELCHFGISISKIANSNNQSLKKLLKSFGISNNEKFNVSNKLSRKFMDDFHLNKSLTIILMALKSYELDIISKELNRFKTFLNAKEFGLQVILPLMSGLGTAIADNEYTISHEHALCSIVLFHMSHYLYFAPKKNLHNSITMIFCVIEGDLHEIGLMISALIALHNGYQVMYLGPNLPADVLIDTVNALDPAYIVIGATDIVNRFEKNYFESYLHKLDTKIQSKCKIIIGTSLEFQAVKKASHQITHLKSIEEFSQYLLSL